MKSLINRFAAWLYRKTTPLPLNSSQWCGTGYLDNYKRTRMPSANELMAELKGTAWTCATLNAAACASNSPRLYVRTSADEALPKCLTGPINKKTDDRLRRLPYLSAYTKSATQIQEVVQHPLLTLLDQVNPIHNAFDP